MSSLADLFKQYGLTGNPVIDSVITMTVIPMIFSYITNLTSIITKILMSLWELFIECLSEKLRIRLFGNKTSTMIIGKNNELYDFLLEEIFIKSTIKEDSNKNKTLFLQQFLQQFYNIIKSFKKYQMDKSYWQNRKNKSPEIVPTLCQNQDGVYYLDHTLQVGENKNENENETISNPYGRANNNTTTTTTTTYVSRQTRPIKKYFQQDNHTIAITYYPVRNRIKIIILNYKKNNNSNEENNKIAIEIIDKFIINRLHYNTKIYHKLYFDINNMKLREVLTELVSSTCPLSIIESIISSFYESQSVPSTFTNYEITQVTDSINDIIKSIDNSPSIPSSSHHYILNGGCINFSTNIINSQIDDYTNYIKLEQRSQTNKSLSKIDLHKIIGKNKIELYSNASTPYEQYSMGLYQDVIIHNGYQIFNFNGIYLMLYLDFIKKVRDNCGNSTQQYTIKLIISKFGNPISMKEVNEIINNVILLAFKVKPYETSIGTNKNISVYKYENKVWKQINLEKRTLDTIYLPKKLLSDILAEITNFFDKKKLYDKFEIYYKKGLLFYGPPGTGKTSLVRALAWHFKIPIYIGCVWY